MTEVGHTWGVAFPEKVKVKDPGSQSASLRAQRETTAMASCLYSEDLTCSVCLEIFTDPVTLLCGHSFCRQCIARVLDAQHQCPLCQTAVAAGGTCPQTSLILKSLAEKAKEGERKKEHEHRAEVAELCPEHEEKLKLFCVTDQQLACIICRDGEKHEGHKFKPIKEAAATVRRELESFVEQVSDDICAVESLASTQREEIRKTKGKSQQLMTQICRQFNEMHVFLRKREDEIRKDLKHKEEEAVEEMSDTLNAMETALSENRELEGKVTSVLTITDSENFLKSWTKENSMTTAKSTFQPRGRNLQVVTTSLSLGPHESHLQFFMWKEMLQVIQPRAEELSLQTNSHNIKVSEDGRSLFCTAKRDQLQSDPFSFLKEYDEPTVTPAFSTITGFHRPKKQFSKRRPRPLLGNTMTFGFATEINTDFECEDTTSSRTNHAYSVNEFSSGQHYWEVEVGHRDYWELGITNNFLKYDGQSYFTCCPNVITVLSFADRPRKIGLYLNCTSKKLSFYNADNMTYIHTMSISLITVPLSAHFNIRYVGPDPNPMTVCWY